MKRVFLGLSYLYLSLCLSINYVAAAEIEDYMEMGNLQTEAEVHVSEAARKDLFLEFNFKHISINDTDEQLAIASLDY